MKDKKNKSLENSVLGLSLGHAALCPVHGILPKLALVAGAGGGFAETGLGKAGAWIHEKEVEGLSYVISKFHKNPYEDYHCSVESHSHNHSHHHNHESPYSDKVLNQSEIGVHTLNWLLVAYSAYIVGKRIYNKFISKSKIHEHQ
jgi:hypothetical protein